MMLRRGFLKRMAMAAVACAFMSDIPMPGLEAAPEPVEEVCGTCKGEGFVIVENRVQPYLSMRAEGSYIPMSDGPTFDQVPCPTCSAPWSKVSDTEGRKDAFVAQMSSYTQLMVKKRNIEQNRMLFGVGA